ncbi:coagulation factor X [Myxocyprinus asiaticus]|uniref:coagulation factor X n=1 Tax=Myxocyprinus asiaticus TaxID=70543 RepID=UPI0022237480|nr:coagulation factor X [Myxocyprinus asiaticus]
MSCLFWNILCVFLIHCVSSEVFLHTQDANQVLSRHRRANTMFEEMKQGNMERECVEERCSYEEAREIYEDDQKTKEFWNKYVDGDACLSTPCLNDGVCKDGIGPYTCFCTAGYKGYNCEIVIPKLCESENGGCAHFCKVDKGKVVCSCANGYTLSSNGKSCQSDDPFKCGVVYPEKTRTIFIYTPSITDTENTDESNSETPVNSDIETVDMSNSSSHSSLDEPDIKIVNGSKNTPVNDTTSLFGYQEPEAENLVNELLHEEEIFVEKKIVNGVDCPPGECPWQALLINEDDVGFCGGTILNEYFILSAAHCMNQNISIRVIVGEFDRLHKEGRESTHNVDQILIHMNFIPETYHNDIALIKLSKPITFTKYIIPACIPERDFAERVLMQQDTGRVSGFGRLHEGGLQSTKLQRLAVPYVDRAKCLESSSFKISSRMFCAGYDQETKDACQGDSGGPHVTRYKDTWFVTGVVSWGEGCARKGKYGIYTQVSKYIKWIYNAMEKVMPQTESLIMPKVKRELLKKTQKSLIRRV